MLLFRVRNCAVRLRSRIDKTICGILESLKSSGPRHCRGVELDSFRIGLALLRHDSYAVKLPMIKTFIKETLCNSIYFFELAVGELGVITLGIVVLVDFVCWLVVNRCLYRLSHRARDIKDQSDIERLRRSRGRDRVRSRREGGQADQEVGFALLDDGLDATGEFHILIEDALIRPDAADVGSVVLGDALPRRNRRLIDDHGLIARSPRRGLGISWSRLRGRHHRRQCKRCAQHSRGQHPGQTPYR